MSGTLKAKEMKIASDELVDKSKDIENGKMLYEVIDFNLPSKGAMAIEFSRLPYMLGLFKEFNRAARLRFGKVECSNLPGSNINNVKKERKVAHLLRSPGRLIRGV